MILLCYAVFAPNCLRSEDCGLNLWLFQLYKLCNLPKHKLYAYHYFH